ncbi:unnamed protein product [Trichobilharzia regenti]|nr:unnamed protein product [Trichobilharzia regenti]
MLRINITCFVTGVNGSLPSVIINVFGDQLLFVSSLNCKQNRHVNKNRLLFGNRVNLTPEIDSFATNTSEIGTMIHSYRLPMFPTLFSKSEHTHDQHTSRINKTSENDDTDSQNSQNTLASVVHSPDNSVKYKDKKLFNDKFSIKNVTSSTTTIKNQSLADHEKRLDSKKIHYDEDLNTNGLNTSKDYTHMKKWMETRGMEMPSMKNKQNSWKSDSNEISDLSNRARQIDRLFGELSRKMYPRLIGNSYDHFVTTLRFTSLVVESKLGDLSHFGSHQENASASQKLNLSSCERTESSVDEWLTIMNYQSGVCDVVTKRLFHQLFPYDVVLRTMVN